MGAVSFPQRRDFQGRHPEVPRFHQRDEGSPVGIQPTKFKLITSQEPYRYLLTVTSKQPRQPTNVVGRKANLGAAFQLQENGIGVLRNSFRLLLCNCEQTLTPENEEWTTTGWLF